MASSPPHTAALNETIELLTIYGNVTGVPLTAAKLNYQLSHYYESKVGSLIAGTVVMVVASTIAVVLRLISRRVKKAKLGADDYVAVAGLIIFYGYVCSFLVVVHYGLGLHILRAGVYKFRHFGKPFYVFQCLYGPVCLTTKLSVLLLYRRVFTITNRAWEVSFWVITTLFVGWAIAIFFKDVFEAVPVRAVWELTTPGKWINPLDAFFITGIINVILTTAIFVLPMPIIWTMQMTLWKRLGLCVLFALGCGDVVVIIARTILIKHEHFPDTDLTWTLTPTSILSIVEQALGILCASLPMVRSLFVSIFSSKKTDPADNSDNEPTAGLKMTNKAVKKNNKASGTAAAGAAFANATFADPEKAVGSQTDKSERLVLAETLSAESMTTSRGPSQPASAEPLRVGKPWDPLNDSHSVGSDDV